MQVVDMGCIDEPVHGRVDGRRCAAAAVEAIVEGRDHLVLASDPRVHVDERAESIESKDREAGLSQCPEIASRPFDPEQLERGPGDRVNPDALRRGVPAGVVRVPRVGAEAMGAVEQRLARRRSVDAHAPHPAWCPPTRSATIRSP